jgi:hypothetical protein
MRMVTIAAGANIQAAIDANPAGTVFHLSAGMYRGQHFRAKSNDQFIGDPSGGTVLSGAVVLHHWTASGGYWVASGLPPPLIGHGVTGTNPLALNLNDLFVDNVLFARVGALSRVTASTWYFDPATKSAYISYKPVGHTVEYSSVPQLTGDNGATGVVVRHLTIEKYAADAQNAPIHGVRDWRIVDVTSTQNHGAGLNIGPGTIVQGGHYTDNGQIGIAGAAANGAQVLGAEIARNNYAGYDIDWEAGGLKMTHSSKVVIAGNNVHDNHGQGLWSDIGDSNFTYANNIVTHNDGNGIMYEISYGGSVIRDNTVTCNGGAQIYISNSQGVEITGNTVMVGAGNGGIQGGISMIYVDRGSGILGPYDTKNNDVHNNVITHLGGSADGLWIYHDLATATKWHNRWDGNTYYVPDAATSHWHFGTSDYLWQALIDQTGRELHGAMFVPPKHVAADCSFTKYGVSGESGIGLALLLSTAWMAIRNWLP